MTPQIDTQQLRLQYEILNKPFSEIAADARTIESAVVTLAKEEGWRQWFPEPDLVLPDTSATPEEMESISEEFTTRTKTRLRMYNIAKDMILAQRYLALEAKIIDKANAMVDEIEEARDIKSLSALYAEMSKSSIKDALAQLTIDDQSGLPTVIFKNMSGMTE